MASSVFLRPHWSSLLLHGNGDRRPAALNRNRIILSSTSQRFPVTFLRFRLRHLSCLFSSGAQKRGNGDAAATPEENQPARLALQGSLWAAEAAYVLWLFFLPYAPGDPVWAIKSNTVNDLVGLSLNFFFILPLANSDVPHKQAIRLNGTSDDEEQSPPKPSQFGLLMTNGARLVGLIGGVVCFVSVIWALFGSPDGGFGDVANRWQFLEEYIRSERLAYAFIWDIFIYAIFQPWLIGDNLQNVKSSNEGLVSALRYVPVLGLAAYLLFLDDDKDL